jgi:hypothetical protein
VISPEGGLHVTTDRKLCFVISPIGAEGSDIRRRADQILRHIITPAVATCGFEAQRADQISEPGLITTQIIQHIIDDPLVIADLTGSNPNVFYELAVRHAIRKPLIQIIQKEEKIPFDVAGMRTVPIDHRDLDSVQEAKQEIERQVKAVTRKKPDEIESPISVSVELQALRHSDNPEERSFAEFVTVVAELRSGLDSIEKRLANPENLMPLAYVQKCMEMSGRRPPRSRETEMMMMDIAHRVESMMLSFDREKAPPKEVALELQRIAEMLMVLRHELRA